MQAISPNLQIYFCGSMRGVEANLEIYKKIVFHLKKYGTVLTEHIVDQSIEIELNDKEIYEKDLNALYKADCLIAEVTSPSHGVGIELGWGIANFEKKLIPILCISCKHKNYKTSALISGCDVLTYKEYENFEDAKTIIDDFFKDKF